MKTKNFDKMETKTAKLIAGQLEKQAELIRDMAKNYKKGKLSGPAYRYMIANRAMALEAITQSVKYYRDEAIKAVIL